MEPTDKQIAANRRNAGKSTGPVTPAGKEIAARNALKHGLLAKEIVIDAGEGAESQEEFDAVLLDLKDQCDPQGPLEEMLVEKIAVAYWRLRRAHRYEVGLIRKKLDNATDKYYQPDPFRPGETKSRADEIDAEISAAEELRHAWQDDQEQFTRLHAAGKDLHEIYEWQDNWSCLFEKLIEVVEDMPDDSPASMRDSLRAAGWTDDQIWQAHLDLCTEQSQVQTRKIEDLQKQKHNHELALQVQKKIGCIPDTHDLDRLLKYEGSIEKQFYKAINQLERLQRMRAGDNVPAPVNIDLAVHTENTG
jgi:hypothetical protein